jgi:hypothetical protein
MHKHKHTNFLTGICKVNIGDNHAGYIGFREPTNKDLLADDGAMDVVINHWRNNS